LGDRILVVDDTPQNVRLLEAVLTGHGYDVVSAATGEEALKAVADTRPDLVLLDIYLPDIQGHEVCQRLRADPATAFLPVVMITAEGARERLPAIESGADDFVTKPFDQSELLARIRSLLRIKAYHDTIEAQAAELSDWNRQLEARVEDQVGELERLSKMRRFLSPQIADLIEAAGEERLLETHRREIAVVFCDLRGFTSFARSAEPEDVMSVLAQFHEAVGGLVREADATVGFFSGDGLMVFFNDPLPCEDPAGRAVRMALALRGRVDRLAETWRKRGHELGFGVGIAQGYATLGRIGFEGRFDYAAIGTVTNLAARLCGEAESGQILVSRRVYAAVEERVEAEAVGELALKGLLRPVPAYNVVGLREAGAVQAG
jgi:adenylate cyclase